MQTQERIKLARGVITDIENGFTLHTVMEQHTEDGQVDHETVEIISSQFEDYVDFLVNGGDNPTLPTLDRLARKAKEAGFDIDKADTTEYFV